MSQVDHQTSMMVYQYSQPVQFMIVHEMANTMTKLYPTVYVVEDTTLGNYHDLACVYFNLTPVNL
jgi:hypothetical protein